ncbi:type IX secretion system membrane protein, PorP/SprF family [Flavobacterium hercynium]|nr:type IX secretion system membrane protein, PorP/SprF family [Flavobacterium hercynium]
MTSFSQEGLAVYSDYLSDNYYLIHPSMAGAANCDKIRLTVRKQWINEDKAPGLQTLSYNTRVGDRSGAGIILFNDQNGYHSQKGAKLTFAHHIMFSRDEIDLDQLSFGINAGFIQAQLDQTGFLEGGITDPIIDGSIQSETYANFDAGASYNFLNMYAHVTIKNVLETRRKIYTEFETDNLRKYLLSSGYIFGDRDGVLWEPSFLLQFTEKSKEKLVDLNLKAYKNFDNGMLWGGLSYRTNLGFESNIFNKTPSPKLQYITPIVGINYENLMFAYTYSAVSGDVKFDNGAFHQITLGINLSCRKEKYDCHCPGVN